MPRTRRPISVEQSNALVLANRRYAHSVARGFFGTGVCKDDLIQAAEWGLIEGCRRYDPARGRVTTFVVWYIRRAIYRCIRESLEIPVSDRNRRHAQYRGFVPISEANGNGEDCPQELMDTRPGPLDRLLADEPAHRFRDALRTLSATERAVIALHSGLGGKAHSLAEIGSLYGGRSREWARNVKVRARRKLKEALKD